MTGRRVLTLATTALLLELFPLVVAHGEVHNEEPAHVQDSGRLQSYWSLSEHVALMYWHIGLEIIAWIVVLPVGVMLSIAHSRLTLVIQFLFLVVNAFALLLGVVYNHRTPELYAKNAHSKIGWTVTWIAVAWVSMSLIQLYTGLPKGNSQDRLPAQSMTTENMIQYQRVQDTQLPDPYRWSNDSGQGTERNSASLCDTRSPSVESENVQFPGLTQRYTRDDEDDVLDDEAEKRGFLGNASVDRFLLHNIGRIAGSRLLKVLRILYVVIERSFMIQVFAAVTSGTIVYGGIGRGDAIFNVMAHFVKGAVFFLYGFLTLGRWTGAFADAGWAWNILPDKTGRKRAPPSAEMVESFFLFLYGITNVFMEHMAAWGDAWSPQDLEHVSISVMLFGGGLLGMIIESRTLRALLNTNVVPQHAPTERYEENLEEPQHYRFSLNPMPLLLILLVGKMMSSHHQDSMVSTMIHAQWGGLLMGAAAARAVTYIVVYISPPTSYLPSRPPSEVIAAFCLISGGLILILSNKDTVAALEAYHLDAMFLFTVTMGFTALMMAWTTILLAIKGWAVRKANASYFLKNNTHVPA